MTIDCDEDKLERDTTELGGGGDVTETPDPDAGILVTYATEKHPITARADFDVHTAITRGLKAYLLTLTGAIAGRSTTLASVITDWADHDDGSRPAPSAAVHSEEVGRYEVDSGHKPGAPQVISAAEPLQMVTVQMTGMYALDELTIDVWCTDKEQRAGVRKMIEDACMPVEWMAGFRLTLPPYHNAIATFLLLSAQLNDASEAAAAGLRLISFKLRARCPVFRVHRLPLARPQARGTITSG